MDRPLTRAQVVDLLRYRREHAAEKTPQGPRLATVSPFRVLTQRQLEHRSRMLTHLAAVRRPTNLSFDF